MCEPRDAATPVVAAAADCANDYNEGFSAVSAAFSNKYLGLREFRSSTQNRIKFRFFSTTKNTTTTITNNNNDDDNNNDKQTNKQTNTQKPTTN